MHPKPAPRANLFESGARLAVLIDADNAQAAVIENVLAEIARFGEATYGDSHQTKPLPSSARRKLAQHPRRNPPFRGNSC